MSESININNSHLKKVTTVIVLVTFLNTLVIIWDIQQLGVEPSFIYFLSKFIFSALPYVFLYTYRFVPRLKNYSLPIISVIYFCYCAYYMSTVHYSYFTAFIQFFMGLVIFFRFTIIGFISTYLIGFVLMLVGVDSLQSLHSPSVYKQMSSDIISSIVPIYIFSWFVFFLINRFEERDEAKTILFKNIGENVGFLIHEIKQPLMTIQNHLGSEKVEEINELLEISNIMWPGSEVAKIEIRPVDLKILIDELLINFHATIEHLNISLNIKGDFPVINSNKQILKIIIKNLIKNSIEANLRKSNSSKYLEIKMVQSDVLQISNSIPADLKLDTKKVFHSGYSKKSNLTNKGLGLYICSQLAKKVSISLGASQVQNSFIMKVKF